MNLKQRIIRYLIGVAIGVVVVFMMFPDHDWLSWTPGKRIMKIIRESEFYISDSGQCAIDCVSVTGEDIAAMRTSGEVNFKKSDTKTDPRKYIITHGDKEFSILIENNKNPRVELIKISGSENCGCP